MPGFGFSPIFFYHYYIFIWKTNFKLEHKLCAMNWMWCYALLRSATNCNFPFYFWVVFSSLSILFSFNVFFPLHVYTHSPASPPYRTTPVHIVRFVYIQYIDMKTDFMWFFGQKLLPRYAPTANIIVRECVW